jgi:hypothetical protein
VSDAIETILVCNFRREAIQLYEEACALEPNTTTFHLSLVHNYEVVNELEKAFQHIKAYGSGGGVVFVIAVFVVVVVVVVVVVCLFICLFV